MSTPTIPTASHARLRRTCAGIAMTPEDPALATADGGLRLGLVLASRADR